MTTRTMRFAALSAILLTTLAIAQPQSSREDAARLMNELMSGKVLVGAPFTLTNAHGKRVSLADFRGKLVLLYFGYTSCPDVCPTDLLAIAQTLKSLGRAGEQVQPLFVTLDPARDTPEALTGSEEEIRRLATAYKVFYEKVRYDKQSRERADLYLIDHAAFTFLLDRTGKYVMFFPPGTPADRMTVMVRERLAAK